MIDNLLCYSAAEVAQLLKLDIKSVYAGLAAGEIPSRRVGKRFLVPKEAFHRWLGQADRATSEAA